MPFNIRTRSNSFYLCFYIITVLLFSSCPGMAYELTVLHTNDLHMRLACKNNTDTAEPLQPLRQAISHFRGIYANVLLLDAGDQYHEIISANPAKTLAKHMNALGYDAMAPGNHDFDLGPAFLAQYAQALSFPVLAANLRVSPALSPLEIIRCYLVLEKQGRKIGLIGLTHDNVVSRDLLGNDLSITNHHESMAHAVKLLEEQHVDIIIALTHVGIPLDKELAKQIPGIDIIVGGHSHALFHNDDPQAIAPYPLVLNSPRNEPVLIVSTEGDRRWLGRLTVVFDERGRIVSWAGPQSGPIDLAASAFGN